MRKSRSILTGPKWDLGRGMGLRDNIHMNIFVTTWLKIIIYSHSINDLKRSTGKVLKPSIWPLCEEARKSDEGHRSCEQPPPDHYLHPSSSSYGHHRSLFLSSGDFNGGAGSEQNQIISFTLDLPQSTWTFSSLLPDCNPDLYLTFALEPNHHQPLWLQQTCLPFTHATPARQLCIYSRVIQQLFTSTKVWINCLQQRTGALLNLHVCCTYLADLSNTLS